MKRINFRKLRYTYRKASLLTIFVCLLLTKGFIVFERTGPNLFHVFVNGVEVGSIADSSRAEPLLQEARRRIASRQEELTFMKADMQIVSEEVLWGQTDTEEAVTAAMENVLQDSVIDTFSRSYTLKVNEYLVNLASMEEAEALLQAAVDKYDTENKFDVELVHAADREWNVLTAQITAVAKQNADEDGDSRSYLQGGVENVLGAMGYQAEVEKELAFEDYELGIQSMRFAEKVEIVESCLPAASLTDLQAAIEEVIKEQETPGEYEVVSGDTLSEIALKVNIPMDKILELNSDVLENENTTIRIGDKLIITVPEPELSVERVEQIYSEEIYDAETIYQEEDSWYTYQTEILQQPSAGFRKIVAEVSYLNDREVSKKIQKEEVIMEAVPKIVKRGTKIPPTYIKPISGGRQSSGFGKRKSPTKGASTYHKGIDWAVPTGTAVFASCGGTVAKAGWGSGYGYVVYINHEDGRQTRYAHLSKVLVKAGQTVKQGERIALSGNTGVSSGPHVHFEILIGGSQVNPLKYLQ